MTCNCRSRRWEEKRVLKEFPGYSQGGLWSISIRIGQVIRRMRSRPEILVFDFDGVLADTEPLHWKSWAALLAPHGICLRWEDYCAIGRGVNDEEMLERLPQFVSNPSLLPGLRRQLGERKKMIENWCSLQSPIAIHTVDLLKSLQAFRVGIVTSSDRGDVEPVLRAAGIHQCFHAFVFANDIRRHKPDPEPYLLIREKLGTGPGIAFEDSDAGLESAAKAGFTAIRIDDPSHLPEIVAKSLNTR